MAHSLLAISLLHLCIGNLEAAASDLKDIEDMHLQDSYVVRRTKAFADIINNKKNWK